MNCPVCRISSMSRVVSGKEEIDRCLACGSVWFDFGEIRELTEGRFSIPTGEGATGDGRGRPPDAGEERAARENPAGEKPGALLSRMRREGASLRCPRCGDPLDAMDFQMTGIPVFHCPGCRGLLAPRRSVAGMQDRFRYLREHRAEYAALGETLARAASDAAEADRGPARRFSIPLPVVVPLADNAPLPGSFPFVTYLLIALSAVPYIVAQVKGIPALLPGGLSGLPSGTGFLGIPKSSLFAAPFLHAGLLPLSAGALFLFVLGDNVEDRLGRLPYLAFYLFCGICAGAAHVIWGKAGGPAALGSAGAVGGVLGAYLVFFPDVSVRMYGMGRVVSVPAYLFACSWVAAAFLVGPGPFSDWLNPSPLSLAGNLAGFGAGVLGAICWRFMEEGAAAR